MNITKNTAYTVSTQYNINYEKLSDLTEIKNFKDSDDLYVINLDSKTITTGVFENKSKDKFNRVIDKALLDKITENPEKIQEFRNAFRPEEPVYLVKKDFLPAFVQYGQYALSSLLGDKEKEIHISKFLSNDIIGDSKNEEYQFLQYVKNENQHETYIDTNGKKYMAPYVFDYTRGQLSNGDYNLDELVEHLSKRDDIAFGIEGQRFHDHVLLQAPLKGNEKGLDKIIEDIPHYNADDERNECIMVVYYPKAEDIDKILNWKKSDPGNKPRDIYSTESFIVKEILGGIAFAKNLPEQHEEEVTPKRKFKR